MRRALMEGLRSVPSVGAVITGQAAQLPFFVVDSDGEEVEPVSAFLRDLMLGDASPLTCRSYAFDLLRWHRLLWCLGTGWEKATEADVATLVGWLRAARNPQREREGPGSAPTRLAPACARPGPTTGPPAAGRPSPRQRRRRRSPSP